MRYYVKIGAWYYEYSTVSDSLSFPMDLAALNKHMAQRPWTAEDRAKTLQELNTRGTDSVYDPDAQAAVRSNYEGLTWDQLLQRYG